MTTNPIDVKLSQLKFPLTCVVCLSPANQQYKLDKIFNYGRRNYTVKLNVPMCKIHAEAAGFKGPAERFMENLAIYGGILGGVLAAISLVLRWSTPEHILVKLFGGGIFGLGTFLILWWIITASVAPHFATLDAKEARNAVNITHYWPREDVVRLKFNQDQIAEMVQKEIVHGIQN